jgi:hypothetical protein
MYTSTSLIAHEYVCGSAGPCGLSRNPTKNSVSSFQLWHTLLKTSGAASTCFWVGNIGIRKFQADKPFPRVKAGEKGNLLTASAPIDCSLMQMTLVGIPSLYDKLSCNVLKEGRSCSRGPASRNQFPKSSIVDVLYVYSLINTLCWRDHELCKYIQP